MNREILFRGKRNTGGWVFGELLSTRIFSIVTTKTEPGIFRQIQKGEVILTASIGQYSTYNDKYGKKIFEGDICKDRFNRILLCCWHNGRLQWQCTDPANNFLYADLFQWVRKGPGFAHNETTLSVVIIGNLTDNPDYLCKNR